MSEVKRKLCPLGMTFVVPAVVAIASILIAFVLTLSITFDLMTWILVAIGIAVAFGLSASSYGYVLLGLAAIVFLLTTNWSPLFTSPFDFLAFVVELKKVISYFLLVLFAVSLGATFGRVVRDIFDKYNCGRTIGAVVSAAKL